MLDQVATDVAILDVSKAFDKVPYKKLPHKLGHSGLRGPLHTWLTTFLIQRSMKVVQESGSSDEVPVESGVPQGTVLFLCHSHQRPPLLCDEPGLLLCR